MRPVMYLISNPSLEMSAGKLAAQVAHAAVQAYRATPDNNVKRMWDCGGHYAKVVLQTDDLRTAQTYISERGFNVVPIIDEGRTEFPDDLTLTALGVEILDKDNVHVAATFSAFKLYGTKSPPAATLGLPEISRKRPAIRLERAWNWLKE